MTELSPFLWSKHAETGGFPATVLLGLGCQVQPVPRELLCAICSLHIMHGKKDDYCCYLSSFQLSEAAAGGETGGPKARAVLGNFNPTLTLVGQRAQRGKLLQVNKADILAVNTRCILSQHVFHQLSL